MDYSMGFPGSLLLPLVLVAVPSPPFPPLLFSSHGVIAPAAVKNVTFPEVLSHSGLGSLSQLGS